MRALTTLMCLLTVSGIPAQSVILPSGIVNGPRPALSANAPITSLANRVFYDQALRFDPRANALGAVSTAGSRWTIGPGTGSPGATLVARTNPATATTGHLYVQWLMALKLN